MREQGSDAQDLAGVPSCLEEIDAAGLHGLASRRQRPLSNIPGELDASGDVVSVIPLS